MVLSGELVMNSEATSLQAQFDIVKEAHDKMLATYAAAILIKMLVCNPWLQSATLEFEPSSEYDDQGGTFRSINVTVTDVECVPDVELPDELQDDGDFRADWAADRLRDDLENNCDTSRIYSSLMDDWDFSDLTVKIDRSKVADLLADPSAISSLEAFRALLPEHLHRIGEQPVEVETLEATPA
jgi:hypothetical protein